MTGEYVSKKILYSCSTSVGRHKDLQKELFTKLDTFSPKKLKSVERPEVWSCLIEVTIESDR